MKRVVWYFEEGLMVTCLNRYFTPERVKVIQQVGAVAAYRNLGVFQILSKMGREEGVRAYWKGNGTLKRVVWYFEEGGVLR